MRTASRTLLVLGTERNVTRHNRQGQDTGILKMLYWRSPLKTHSSAIFSADTVQHLPDADERVQQCGTWRVEMEKVLLFLPPAPALLCQSVA